MCVVNTRRSHICFTTKCLCYESLLQAEPITVNETISETLRARGGIQIKAPLASHSLSLHLHNYGYDTGLSTLSLSVFVCAYPQCISEVTACTKRAGLITKCLCTKQRSRGAEEGDCLEPIAVSVTHTHTHTHTHMRAQMLGLEKKRTKVESYCGAKPVTGGRVIRRSVCFKVSGSVDVSIAYLCFMAPPGPPKRNTKPGTLNSPA